MTETDRIIDANANRVCEAFRVLEDLARFALNRADLSARAKDARHTVRRVVGPRGLKARDTPGDVGGFDHE